MFKILLTALLPLLFLIGCSSEKETVKRSAERTGEIAVVEADKEKALEHFINGSIAESKGDFASAIIEYQDALRLDPGAGVYYALAKNYFSLNKIPLALQHSKKSIELDSANTEYYELLSDIFSAAHQYDSSAVVLEKLLVIDPESISGHYKLARLYENSKPLKAIDIYKNLTNNIGPEWNVLIRVAELYEKLGEYKKASETMEELVALDPSNTALQKLLAEFYEKEEAYEKAHSVLDDIIELTPDDLDARERKAQLYLKQDEWEDASEQYSYILSQPDVPLEIKLRIGASYFNESLKDSTLLPITKEFFNTIDKDTSDWQVKMYLGAIALNENKDEEAIESFRSVTKLANWNVEAWIRLGGLYFDNQKYAEAETVMLEAIESFPQDFAVNLILGLSLAQQEQHEKAKEYLKNAVDLNPRDPTALSAYGFTLNQLKESDEAVKYLKKALTVNPNDVNLLGTLGMIYDAQENWAECDSVYQLALELDSVNALVNNNYAYSLSEREIKLDEALEMAKIAIEADPENSSYLDTIGWVYFKLGEYVKAKEFIEKSIEVGGESAIMLEHLGDIVFMMGEKNKAQQLWQQAFDLDASNDDLKLKIEKGEI